MPGADIVVRGLAWRPTRRRTPVFAGLDLQIPVGQRVLLVGRNGAGKSTLLRALAGVLLTAESGDLSGEVCVAGAPAVERQARPGLLLQNPTAGIVADTVGRDVAFGLENAAVPRPEIWPRVRAALVETGFPYGPAHPTGALSGGEAQRLALAGALVLDSGLLLLDEPLSMLDPESADAVISAVAGFVANRSTTLVIADHQIDPWLGIVDRLVVLGSDGSVVADGPPPEVLRTGGRGLADQGVWVPGLPTPDPIAVPDDLVEPWQPGPACPVRAEQVGLVLRHRLLAPGERVSALRGVDATVSAGRVLAVTGRSGAGKSSLVTLLAGLVRPTGGRVLAAAELATRRGAEPHRWGSRDLARRLSFVPQFPEHAIVTHTVRDEMLASARACGRDMARAQRRADGLLDVFGLSALAEASPYHLSGGEQRRLAVAAGFAAGAFAVMLDEPTVGQDRSTWRAVAGAVLAAKTAGTAVALATHDWRAVDALADDTLALADGAPADGAPADGSAA